MRQQGALTEQHGKKVQGKRFEKPLRVAGIGEEAKLCHDLAAAAGTARDGKSFPYTTPVIPPSADQQEGDVPALAELDDLEAMNACMGTRNGRLSPVPDGKENDIIWPLGIRQTPWGAAMPSAPNCGPIPTGNTNTTLHMMHSST